MIEHISQLKQIEDSVLDSLLEEVLETEIKWVDSYSDYQSGGWQVASLYNSTGEETYDVPDEKENLPTQLLARMPRMREFLDSTGLEYMMARLTRILPSSRLYEHVDYCGLEKRQKFRLHIPLVTNPGSLISLIDVNVFMKRGYVWKLDPKSAIHGACNLGNEQRIHLLLDCYMNDALKELIEGQWLDSDCVTERPQITDETTRSVMNRAKQLLEDGKSLEAEHCILDTFHEYRHPRTSSSYDLILDLYEKNKPEKEKIDYWLDRLNEVYGAEHVERRGQMRQASSCRDQ